MNLAMTYEWLHDSARAGSATDKAIELLERAVRRNPKVATVRADLAALFARKELKEKAIENIRIALALARIISMFFLKSRMHMN